MIDLARQKQLVEEHYAAFWSDASDETLAAQLTPDFVDHAIPPGTPPGPSPVLAWRKAMRSAFPDMQVTVADAVAEGDRVAVRALCLAGAVMTVSNASANTLLQRTAGPRLRGQTAGLYMLVMRGGRSIGDLLTGGSVKLLGVRSALLIDGGLAVLVQLALARAWALHVRTGRRAPHGEKRG
jgi:predicted SnoaL-like aldol condensation-catalyzing enzyme